MEKLAKLNPRKKYPLYGILQFPILKWHSLCVLYVVRYEQIEEMRDEYTLKLKLRNGAFNIAQALATQSSKAAKEKLQEARLEQRELLEVGGYGRMGVGVGVWVCVWVMCVCV